LSPESLRNTVTDRLREAGLRATRPRVLVLSVLRDVGGHRSVDEIVKLLDRRGESIPRMSVYNVVADLTDASIVMCADAGPGRALYEAADGWHHHFVCRACGRVEDVPCARGHKPCMQPPASLDFYVDEAQVIFRGICAECKTPTRTTASVSRRSSESTSRS
jgi:Fur family ferric uptake transcriptional regulator